MEELIRVYIKNVYPTSRNKLKTEKKFTRYVTNNPLLFNKPLVPINSTMSKIAFYVILKDDIMTTFNVDININDNIDNMIKRHLYF